MAWWLMPGFRPTRQWWYIIGGVLGFWLLLVLVGQLDWVPAGALVEIFFVSIVALALAVGAVGMLAFMENKQGSGSAEERGEEAKDHGQDHDRNREDRVDAHPR